MAQYDVMILSGGFDPLHKGHVRMIQDARQRANRVIIGINSDEWLIRKKGRYFMDFEERSEIVSAIRGVTTVLNFDDRDDTAIDLIKRVHAMAPSMHIAFGNGGDRTSDNVPEVAICMELGVDLVWGVGGGKVQSSTELVEQYEQDVEV